MFILGYIAKIWNGAKGQNIETKRPLKFRASINIIRCQACDLSCFGKVIDGEVPGRPSLGTITQIASLTPNAKQSGRVRGRTKSKAPAGQEIVNYLSSLMGSVQVTGTLVRDESW